MPLNFLPSNSVTRLRNKSCVYCGCLLDRSNSTKEHVVGRRFVPKGALAGGWNLIVAACRACNTAKSDLEDDISAITMHPDAAGAFPSDDAVLRDDASRKARNSRSRLTGKPVADSIERLSFDIAFAPGIDFSFTAVAPPRVDLRRLNALARMHLAAFFYMITYQESEAVGFHWPGSFMPLDSVSRSDWGNVVQTSFAKAVKGWEPRVIGAAAAGFFKVALRRHPESPTWSWALEWNQNYRLIGFLGDLAASQAVVDGFPPMPSHHLQTKASRLRVRLDTPMDPTSDVLFDWEGQDLGAEV